MKTLQKFWVSPIAFIMAMTMSCQQETKKSGGGAQITPINQQNQQNANQSSVNTGGKVFYAGYDGVNDYSIILPGFRDYTIADPSIATVTKENVLLSEDTVNELIASVQASNPNFTDEAVERFRQFMGREQAAYRITPLRAGTTTLSSNRGGRGGQDAWGSNSTTTQLVINAYTPEQYSAGQKRYTTSGSGLLKACQSCHETGEEDAPPHELGNIKEVSDEGGIEWITTGRYGSRVASISHTWEFSSQEERDGILPFLRGKVSKDLETFTKLVVEERLMNFDPNNPPRPPQ